MKILLLTALPYYSDRGSPIGVDHLLEVFSRRRVEVDVLTLHLGSDVARDFVTLHRTPKLPFIKDLPLGFSWKKLICDIVLLFYALKMVKKNGYAVLHAVEDAVFVAMVCKAFFGVPYVYDMDSSMPEQMVAKTPHFRFFLWFLRRFERAAIENSLAVAAVCPALAEIVRGYFPEKPTFLLSDHYGFCDTTREAVPSAKCIRELGSPVIMYVGNLEPYQGIDLLLASFKAALDHGGSAKLVLVGGTTTKMSQYQRKVESLGLQGEVYFLGSVPRAEVPTYLRSADLLVSPRISGINTPMKVYTYLVSGKALLATNITAHTQVLNETVCVLADPTPREFGLAMVKLLRNEGLRRDLGNAARKLAMDFYNPDVFENEFRRIYDYVESKVAGLGQGTPPRA